MTTARWRSPTSACCRSSSAGDGAGYLLTERGPRRRGGCDPERVWLHTCTLDHPAALPNYLHRGFSPTRTESYTATIPPT